MNARNISLIITAVLIAFAAPAVAQERLGDIVAQYGYDSMIGTWTSTNDDGQLIELEYKWILDKCAICANVTIGDFKYHGLIMFVQSEEEVVQIGADNTGATWNGTWTEDYQGAVNRNQRVKPDGTTETMDMVYIKVDNDTFRVIEYTVESSGYRASQARGETTFKRKKTDTAQLTENKGELDGTWIGTAADEYDQWTFIISEGKVEVKAPQSEYYSGTVKLNTNAKPKQVDFKINRCSTPEYIGETSLGIYKLEGDKLTLTVSEPGSMSRPYYLESSSETKMFSLTRKQNK